MKVLLDEDMPHKLRHYLTGHEVFTVRYLGWNGLRNGNLMRKAVENGFDVFLTFDRGLSHQRPVEAVSLAIVLIRLGENRLDDLVGSIDRIRTAIDEAQPDSLVMLMG